MGFRRNPFRVANRLMCAFVPGLPKRNPGLELSNAFSVIRGAYTKTT